MAHPFPRLRSKSGQDAHFWERGVPHLRGGVTVPDLRPCRRATWPLHVGGHSWSLGDGPRLLYRLAVRCLVHPRVQTRPALGASTGAPVAQPGVLEIAPRSFAIVANGFADGPAQALRDYLVARRAFVVAVSHPLVPEGGKRHVVAVYQGGSRIRTQQYSFPIGPPWSFALDPFVPMSLPRVDTWFGFNPLACGRGLLARRLRRTGTVVYWCADFTPGRFGRSPLTAVYDTLDRLCARKADARFELAAAARDARNARQGLDPQAGAPTRIVPMGAWVERVPKVPEDAFRSRRVVFLGHLVARQGVEILLAALALLHGRGQQISADLIGGGPLLGQLKALARRLELGDVVRFHGFLPDHADVERLLAQGSLAVAPYVPVPASLTRYADPGKLKAYLAAGLPIVLTDVPPNAVELAEQAGAEIVPPEAFALAGAIERAFASEDEWCRRRAAALAYAGRFDWNILLREALASVGFQE